MTQVKHQVKHHVTFYTPGSFLPEEYSFEIPGRTVDAVLAVAPTAAYAYELYDTAVVDFEFDADLFRVIPRARNKSPKHYIGGVVYTVDDLRNLAIAEGDPKRYDILIANVSTYVAGEGFVDGEAIRCPPGNWQPYNGETIVGEFSRAS